MGHSKAIFEGHKSALSNNCILFGVQFLKRIVFKRALGGAMSNRGGWNVLEEGWLETGFLGRKHSNKIRGPYYD